MFESASMDNMPPTQVSAQVLNEQTQTRAPFPTISSAGVTRVLAGVTRVLAVETDHMDSEPSSLPSGMALGFSLSHLYHPSEGAVKYL